MSSRDIQIYFWRRRGTGSAMKESREVGSAGISKRQACSKGGRLMREDSKDVFPGTSRF